MTTSTTSTIVLFNTSHFKHGSFVHAKLPDGAIISKTFIDDECNLATINDWKLSITDKFTKLIWIMTRYFVTTYRGIDQGWATVRTTTNKVKAEQFLTLLNKVRPDYSNKVKVINY